MFLLFSYTYILSWSLLLFLLFVPFAFLFVYLFLTQSSLSFSLCVFYLHPVSLSLSLTLDVWSSLFSSVVLIITSVVFLFTSVYFSSFTNITYFLWVTFLFVLSILFLINFSDIFFVILGWDGLGIVSFFLILYYQTSTSSFSALFTVLINRLGDSILILTICIFFSSLSSPIFIFSSHSSPLLALVLLVGLSTNSALFPFSPWLPAAMAAPTPISSLVHSSTLVTAGLYLMIRNYDYLSAFSLVLDLLTCVGLFTSLYAGLSALIEADLNKIVALSTLSHLGIIALSLGLGWTNLAIFHLLSHALFKSALFISLGSFISFSLHYQDSRYLSSLSSPYPSYSAVIILSEANLFALPFLSGFYSKDYILEVLPYSNFGGPFLVLVAYANVLLTYCYSLRTFLSLSSPSNSNPFSLHSPSSLLFVSSLATLSLMGLVFGLSFSSLLNPPHSLVPLFLNLLPSSILILTLLPLSLWYSRNYGVPFLPIVQHSLSQIFYLSPLWSSIFSRIFINSSFSLLTQVESGLLNTLVVRFPSSLAQVSSTSLAYLFLSPLNLPSSILILTLLPLALFMLFFHWSLS